MMMGGGAVGAWATLKLVDMGYDWCFELAAMGAPTLLAIAAVLAVLSNTRSLKPVPDLDSPAVTATMDMDADGGLWPRQQWLCVFDDMARAVLSIHGLDCGDQRVAGGGYGDCANGRSFVRAIFGAAQH